MIMESCQVVFWSWLWKRRLNKVLPSKKCILSLGKTSYWKAFIRKYLCCISVALYPGSHIKREVESGMRSPMSDVYLDSMDSKLPCMCTSFFYTQCVHDPCGEEVATERPASSGASSMCFQGKRHLREITYQAPPLTKYFWLFRQPKNSG